MLIAEDKFTWPRWLKDGYEWREVEFPNGDKESFLAIRKLADLPQANLQRLLELPTAPGFYQPLQNKTLLTRFAKIDISTDETAKKGIVEFAEMFGHLGLVERAHQKAEVDLSRGHNDPAENSSDRINEILANATHEKRGEGLIWWMAEIKKVKEAIQICNGVANGNKQDKLTDLMRVCRMIDVSLMGEIHSVSEVNDTVDGINFRLIPQTLRGAIWLQLTLLCSRGSRWKICGYCGDLFEAKSAKKQYCSQSHQQMAHRKRKNPQKHNG